MPDQETSIPEELRVPPVLAAPVKPKGALIIIGGREQKEGHRPILMEIAARVGRGKLVLATIASEEPEEQWEEYRKVFNELGVQRMEHLNVRRREELLDAPRLDMLEDARVLFFAGGDQMKITSKFGGTPLCSRMRELYESGATIAGTSSGASAMSEVMMMGGDENSSKSVEAPRLAAGLGLVPGLIIDQHFAERGRIARLIKAVGQNPRLLGVGIDENTAIVLNSHDEFIVIGSGAVYVLDGTAVGYSNAAEEDCPAPSVFGLKLHVLSETDRFDLSARTPATAPREEINEELAASH